MRMLPLADPLDPLFRGALAVVNVVFDFWRIDDGEERLMHGQGRPIVGFVDRALVDKIEVELAGADRAVADGFDVSREVAGVLEPVRDGPNARRQAKIVF